MRTIAILIDDDVFLQHILGLIFILVDKGYNPSVVLTDKAENTLTAMRILNHLNEDGFIKIIVAHRGTFKPTEKYDLIVTQWGPPRTFLRRLKHAKNILLHSYQWKYENIYAFPHGFEIKSQSIEVSRMSVIRSILTTFSTNPFEDYNKFYTKYFFESKEHENRYQQFLSSDVRKTIGFVTFNHLTIKRIRKYIVDNNIEDVYYPNNILVMPKLKHVNDSIYDLKSFNGLIFLHPREKNQQELFFRKVRDIRLSDTCIDYFALRKSNTIYDYGTSVSLLAKVMGATVVFEKKLKAELIFHPDQFEKLSKSDFFTPSTGSYQNLMKHIIDELGLSNGK